MADVGIFPPHSDDGELTLGATTRGLLEDGHRVWVVLMTTGVNSGAQPGTGLSKEEFGRARDDEQQRAARRLGIRPEHILIGPDRVADGDLTVAAAETVIREWLILVADLAEYSELDVGDVWVKTTTNLGGSVQHPDHRNAGQAAVNLLRAGDIQPNGLRLGIEQYQLQAWKAANPSLASKVMTDTASPAVVRAALDVYGEEDSAGWKFGIGHRSVASAFATVRANPVSYYHVPVF